MERPSKGAATEACCSEQTLRYAFEALEQKFMTSPDLKELLLSTGDEKLVHYSKDDLFWGDPGDGSGQNVLGKMLMELRNNLREHKS